MSAHVLVLYNPPADPQAFNDHYFGTHVPLVKKIPGLRRNSVSEGAVNAMSPGATYHLIANLEFASMADLQAGLGSPEGQATAADVANFASAGATILVYEAQDR